MGTRNAKGSGCYDYQLKWHDHKPLTVADRYVSRTTGKCRRLKVQSTKAPRLYSFQTLPTVQGQAVNYERVPITDHIQWTTRLPAEIVTEQFESGGACLLWVLRFFGLWGAMLWRTFLALHMIWNAHLPAQFMYPRYLHKFYGHFWAARSRKEFELHQQRLAANPNARPSLSPVTGGVYGSSDPRIYRAHFPRQLMVDPQFALDHMNLNETQRQNARALIDNAPHIWYPIAQEPEYEQYLATAKYIAISYRRGAYYGDSKVKGRLDPELRENLLKDIVSACRQLGVHAYWFDELCMGETWEEKNHDLYRIADVFRGACATVIMVPGNGKDKVSEDGVFGDAKEWEAWGNRVWTFPEGLLSKTLYYKIGDCDAIPIQLRQLAHLAFKKDQDQVAVVIDHYSGRDNLSRLEFLSLLKDAIWRRKEKPPPSMSNGTDSANEKDSLSGLVYPDSVLTPEEKPTDKFAPPPAECVYALMGFFEHRILPDHLETEMQALARLSVVNDDDSFAERMVSMLPSEIPRSSCWYADDDVYDARLWDIEPFVQVCGVTESGSLVLDGCRAAIIRWKNFPKVGLLTKGSFRRASASAGAYLGALFFIIGVAIVSYQPGGGATLLVLGVLILFASPWLFHYAHSGRVIESEPWLVGVEGVITAAEAESHIYGTMPTGTLAPKIWESPTGSPLAMAVQSGDLRQGAAAYQNALAKERHHETQRTGIKVFSLVDTRANTLYYFEAREPPTVCVFTGREGGLGRYVLCTEHCDRNELHKEAVLRMPTFISHHMYPTDWIAIGRAVPDHTHSFQTSPDTPVPFKEGTLAKRWELPQLNWGISLDPVGLITLFLDHPEKEIMAQSPDMSYFACIGLFANPTTAWSEYGTLYPGAGIKYYNPKHHLTSTVEVAHVNNYLLRFANGRQDVGVIINLLPLSKAHPPFHYEWTVIRPLVLGSLILLAGFSQDYFGLGALGALLSGQALVVATTIHKTVPKDTTKEGEEKNVFFLANNVTLIVQSQGDLFVQACSNLKYTKRERPPKLEVLSTVIFMGGVFLVGIAGNDFKLAYVLAHVAQAVLLALHSKDELGSQKRNGVFWDVDEKSEVRLLRRRHAYVWATEATTKNPEWLELNNLATKDTLKWVQEKVDERAKVCIFLIIADE